MSVIERDFVEYCHLYGLDISWGNNETVSLTKTINGKLIVLELPYDEALTYLEGVMKEAADAD